MKTNSQHYWRHHGRVFRALWDKLPHYTRDIIAGDVDQKTAESDWFATKIEVDATRLYEDETHWQNEKFSFGSAFEELRLAA